MIMRAVDQETVMTERLESVGLLHRDEIVAPPELAARACEDHNFELPTGIYAAMAFCFAAAIAVLASAFKTNMSVSYGAVAAFLVAFFAVPVLLVKTSAENGSKALSWRRFRQRGIATATGHTGAGEATLLVLMLPFFILCFAIAVTVIAGSVR
jgi:cobalamin synthase